MSMNQTYILVRKKGDIKFYENEAGELFQQLPNDEAIIPVVSDRIVYQDIDCNNHYCLKYGLNGISGYSVWTTDGVCLEDGFWILSEAEQCFHEQSIPCHHCSTSVYFEQSPTYEICSTCENYFCADCMDFEHFEEGQDLYCKTCSPYLNR